MDMPLLLQQAMLAGMVGIIVGIEKEKGEGKE